MDGLMLTIDDNGVAHAYDDKWDIVIHCESREEHERVLAKIKRGYELVEAEGKA